MTIWMTESRGVAALRNKQMPLAPPFGLVIAVGLTASVGDLPVVRMPTTPTGPLILPALDKPSLARPRGGLRDGRSDDTPWRASIIEGRQPIATLAIFHDRRALPARRRAKRGRPQASPQALAAATRVGHWTFMPDDIAPLGVEHAIVAWDATTTRPAALAVAPLLPPKGLSEPSENRRVAPLGIAADTLRFDDRPGCFSTAAETARWNGQPAAVMGFGYTLPDGRARLNASGVASVMPGPKTFGVSAVASIALE